MQWNIKRSTPFFALPLLAFAANAAPLTATAATAPELGMWVWQHKSIRDAAVREDLVAFAKRHEIKRILIQIRFQGESGARRVADAEEFRDLLQRANAAGVAVEALDGSKDMGLEINRADTLQRLDAIIAFQKELPADARLAGVHYDIEPYLNERWKSGDKQGVMRETLETFAGIRAKVTPETGLLLAHDIPSFYDRHPDALSIEFNGEKKNFHEHIQDLSDYVGVMSYRTKATGPNSIIDLCSAELAYAEKIGKKIYPSIETGRLKDEPKITFYGATPETFKGVLKEVMETAATSPAYGGVFLHHYDSLPPLLEPEQK